MDMHILFIHSSVDGHLCFQVEAVMDNGIMLPSISMCKSLCGHMFSFLLD